MQIKYYDPKELARKVTLKIEPPAGWYPIAFGGVKATHFSSQAHLDRAKKVHEVDRPSINESTYELCVELSVLEAIRAPRIVFMELGAGWGGQTINIVTTVRNHVVETDVRSVYTYAVEAEPGHYRFLYETFRENQLVGVPIFGAVSGTLDWSLFYAEKPPADNYGQSLHPRGNITVPCFTLENLVRTFRIEQVDLVHMDIQGAEPGALTGGLPVITRFRFILVCPHYTEHVDSIGQILSPTHDLVINFGPQTGYHDVPGFPLPVHFPQDGIMLWERKDN